MTKILQNYKESYHDQIPTLTLEVSEGCVLHLSFIYVLWIQRTNILYMFSNFDQLGCTRRTYLGSALQNKVKSLLQNWNLISSCYSVVSRDSINAVRSTGS